MLSKKELDEQELKQRADECMADFGDEAVKIWEQKGRIAATAFIEKKMEPYRARWASEATPSIPLTGEMLALREEIGKDIELRLKMGHTGFAFNPSSSIEDQAKAQWNRDPNLRQEFFGNFDAYKAYLKAEAEGRVRFAGGKIIRGNIDERQPFNNP